VETEREVFSAQLSSAYKYHFALIALYVCHHRRGKHSTNLGCSLYWNPFSNSHPALP